VTMVQRDRDVVRELRNLTVAWFCDEGFVLRSRPLSQPAMRGPATPTGLAEIGPLETSRTCSSRSAAAR